MSSKLIGTPSYDDMRTSPSSNMQERRRSSALTFSPSLGVTSVASVGVQAGETLVVSSDNGAPTGAALEGSATSAPTVAVEDSPTDTATDEALRKRIAVLEVCTCVVV